MERRELDLVGAPSATPDEVEARVDEQAVDPGIEPLRIAERRQVAPSPDQCLLDRVSRELVVPEDQPGCRVQPRDGRAGQRREGVMIASLRSLDETSLVHGRLGYRRGLGGRAR